MRGSSWLVRRSVFKLWCSSGEARVVSVYVCVCVCVFPFFSQENIEQQWDNDICLHITVYLLCYCAGAAPIAVLIFRSSSGTINIMFQWWCQHQDGTSVSSVQRKCVVTALICVMVWICLLCHRDPFMCSVCTAAHETSHSCGRPASELSSDVAA